MKNQFINSNEKLLRNGGRKISKLITKKEFIQKLLEVNFLIDKIEKDLKYADCENFYVGWNGEYLNFGCCEESHLKKAVQLSPTKNIPYLPIYYGGDWELPVRAVVYFDGKKLRAYTAVYGNSVNLETKSAFGNSYNENEDIDTYEELERYCLKQGLDVSDIEDSEDLICIDAMLIDFESRVEIIE